MSTKSNAPEIFYDFISSFEAGINSGVEPLLLPKNQLAFGLNTSVRGAYVTHRPPIQKRDLIFASPLDQTTVETGLFQGAGYYRPDYGTEQLIAHIAGHLFSFTETGGKFVVADISVPGDFNLAITAQVWMWQSEKWLIVQDGTGKLPIFYDGTISRRSYGDSTLLGTTIASGNFPTPRVIGETLTLNLAANYTGPFNVPVIFHGAYYQAASNLVGFPAILKNINNLSGPLLASTQNQFIVHPIPVSSGIKLTSSSSIDASQSFVGAIYPPTVPPCSLSGNASNYTGYWQLPTGTSISVTINKPFITVPLTITLNLTQVYTRGYCDSILGGVPGVNLNLTAGVAVIWNIISVSSDGLTLQLQSTSDYNGTQEGWYNSQFTDPTYGLVYSNYTWYNSSKWSITPNQDISNTTTQPNYSIGKLVLDAIIPGNGATVTVYLDQAYTGNPNQAVTWGSLGFEISPGPTPAASAILYLTNLTDTANPGAAIPIGSPLGDILSVPELPAGRMGAYGMSRNAMSLTDGISFIYGDIGRGAAGTPAYNRRDSVLKTTENTFTGGNFGLPGTGDIITAMIFGANLDASLGQGPLQVGTAYSMFTCDVGFDRTLWPTQNNPILTEALIGKGPLAQNSTISVNSDTFFRSTEGIASLILARRDFGQFGSPSWGNVPISQEMKRIIEKDNQSLLSYGSAITYDNRFLSTTAPNVSSQGVYHAGLLAMNFDAISNLRTKLPPVYDGVWTGVNALQIISGFVNGFKRAFAFTVNLATNKIELYEFLPEITTQIQDNGNVPVVWIFETPILFNKDIKPLTELVKLRDGEIYLKDIVGTVNIEVQYRPDFYPCWTTWRNFNVCADSNTTVTDSQPGYRTRIGLGEPDSGPCEAANNRPMRTGYFFQCRVVITGSCKWMGMRASAVIEPQPVFALPICEGVCP